MEGYGDVRNAAAGTQSECPDAGIAERSGKVRHVLVLAGETTPSQNDLNRMHWSRRHGLRERYSRLLRVWLSRLSVMARGNSTTIIWSGGASSCETQSLRHSAGRETRKGTGWSLGILKLRRKKVAR